MNRPTKPPPSPDAAPPVTDTIPRLHRIGDHARDQLIGLASSADNFEDCRERYLQTQQRLEREGCGRVTASRIGDAERNWAPTRDCLQELMRWGALEPARLPSERKFLDRYRDARYVLTTRGHEMVEAARTSRAAFTDAVSACLIEAHPYLRGLLDALQAGPIVYPTVERGDVKRARAQQRTVTEWAAWGAEQIAGDASVKQTEHELKRALDRFRNRGRTSRATRRWPRRSATDSPSPASSPGTLPATRRRSVHSCAGAQSCCSTTTATTCPPIPRRWSSGAARTSAWPLTGAC